MCAPIARKGVQSVPVPPDHFRYCALSPIALKIPSNESGTVLRKQFESCAFFAPVTNRLRLYYVYNRSNIGTFEFRNWSGRYHRPSYKFWRNPRYGEMDTYLWYDFRTAGNHDLLRNDRSAILEKIVSIDKFSNRFLGL